MSVFWSIVDLVEHDVFKSNPAVGLFQIESNGVHQLFNRIAFIDPHHGRTHFIVWCMQGNRQVYLQAIVSKLANLSGQTTGGNGDMAGTDSQPFGIIDDVDKLHHIVIIVKRFANPHHDHMRDPLPLPFFVKVPLHQHDLRSDFAGSQIPLFPQKTTGTKSTADIAADLGGDADGHPVLLAHQDGFNHHLIWQLKQVFHRPVFSFLDDDLFQRIDDKVCF